MSYSKTEPIEKLVDAADSYEFLKFLTTIIFKYQGILKLLSRDKNIDKLREMMEQAEWKLIDL